MTDLEQTTPKPTIALTEGIVPKTLAEVWRFSELMQAAGLAPKSFDRPEKIAIGILTNMELGRPVLTGLQDLAVINGRAGLWGDGALAMVRESRELTDFTEWSEGEPRKDGWVFFCHIRRKGEKPCREPELESQAKCYECTHRYNCPHVGTWSWEDARLAGVHNASPPSPWARFTRRMMQFKARNFILRDKFTDVLRGMKLAEDLYDSEPIDVTPVPDKPETDLEKALKNEGLEERSAESHEDRKTQPDPYQDMGVESMVEPRKVIDSMMEEEMRSKAEKLAPTPPPIHQDPTEWGHPPEYPEPTKPKKRGRKVDWSKKWEKFKKDNPGAERAFVEEYPDASSFLEVPEEERPAVLEILMSTIKANQKAREQLNEIKYPPPNVGLEEDDIPNTFKE